MEQKQPTSYQSPSIDEVPLSSLVSSKFADFKEVEKLFLS
jgi:hypothetical protein